MLREWKRKGSALKLISLGSDLNATTTDVGEAADILHIDAKKVFFGASHDTRSFDLAEVSFAVGRNPNSLDVSFPTGDRLLFVERSLT